ncbi:MAG: YadA-like family protein, partial [Burkholderia sp.]
SSGLIGDDGKARAAVTYDMNKSGNADFASVTLGGTGATQAVTLHNVAAGTVTTDAVNVSQLKGVTEVLGGDAAVGSDGTVTAPSYEIGGKHYDNVGDAIKAASEIGTGTDPNAVAYDGDAKDVVTLAGKDGTTLKNLKAGDLSASSMEAINGSQLNTVAQNIADHLGGGATFDPATGKISAPSYELATSDGSKAKYDSVGDAFQNLDERVTQNNTQIGDMKKGLDNTVRYDDDSHAAVTLGTKDTGPVALKNVADGTDETDAVNVRQLHAAGLVDDEGLMRSAVVYDKNEDGTTNFGSVTLGGNDASSPVELHNVAAGKAQTDAANVSQLSGVTAALGGDAGIDASTGNVIAPSYEIGGDTYHNVGDALTNLDGRVKSIQDDIGEEINLAGAVSYDRNADGSVNFGSVTLGNGLASGPVVLTNVADGASQYDAVNFGQLSALSDRVDDLDGRIGSEIIPTDPNPGGGDSELVSGTGGSGGDAGEVVKPIAGNGNGNTAAGSSAMVSNDINNATATGAGSRVQAEGGTAVGQGARVQAGADNAVALGSGSIANEANTVSIGSEGHERRLTNVAAGVKPTDAINKGQFDQAMGNVHGQINDLSKNAYSGIAAATALTMIPGVDPGKNLSFGIAGASYRGYQAVALGGEARITENLKMRAGVGLASGGNTFGVGASYQW